MPVLHVAPEYRSFLQQAELTSPESILDLSGVIYSGHPNRHVRRLVIGDGPQKIAVFMKREHRVPLRQRVANVLAGFGFRSVSCREYFQLRTLRAAGIPVPEPLAAGEDNQGRAFLLLREIAGTVDLRTYLQMNARQGVFEIARKLALILAGMHNAGFDHPDLYAKHILVKPAGDCCQLIILDWQRSRQVGTVSWHRRYRDLSALHASLADDFVSGQDRLRFLRDYLECCRNAANRTGDIPKLQIAAAEIRKRAALLLQRRRIREMRQPPLTTGRQNLIWLDGEEFCVTRQFQEEAREQIPHVRRLAYRSAELQGELQQAINLPLGSREACLFQGSENCLRQWILNWFRRRPLSSRQLSKAATIFRLERFHVKTPRLLAVGQRQAKPWRLESFVLIEPHHDATPLRDWLATHPSTEVSDERRNIITLAAKCLRAIHDAGYVVWQCELMVQRTPSLTRLCNENPKRERGNAPSPSLTRLCNENPKRERGNAPSPSLTLRVLEVVLNRVPEARPRRRRSPTVFEQDLAKFLQTIAAVTSESEMQQFWHVYHGGRTAPPSQLVAGTTT